MRNRIDWNGRYYSSFKASPGIESRWNRVFGLLLTSSDFLPGAGHRGSDRAFNADHHLAQFGVLRDTHAVAAQRGFCPQLAWQSALPRVARPFEIGQ